MPKAEANLVRGTDDGCRTRGGAAIVAGDMRLLTFFVPALRDNSAKEWRGAA
jgi:hypothetical protein